VHNLTMNRYGTDGRKARRIQRETGLRPAEALELAQRELLPAGACPACGSYDLGTEHGGGGQIVAACNDCPWIAG
jgi:ssDNA-binding Zn-finger/Zn-ribbon topoisomerase 1